MTDSYTDKIEHLRQENESGDANRIAGALDGAIELLEEMLDELESVWQMLDEIKASDVKNHKDAQYESIDKALSKAKLMMMTKVGKA
jgi:hypothetical protein